MQQDKIIFGFFWLVCTMVMGWLMFSAMMNGDRYDFVIGLIFSILFLLACIKAFDEK